MTTSTLGRLDRQELFVMAAEAYLAGEDGTCRDVNDENRTINEACGLVWNDQDIVPGGALLDDLREVLGFKTRTYASVARALRAYVETDKARA